MTTFLVDIEFLKERFDDLGEVIADDQVLAASSDW